MPLDLHVLGLSLAFILSQDQTLRCIFVVCLELLPIPFVSTKKTGEQKINKHPKKTVILKLLRFTNLFLFFYVLLNGYQYIYKCINDFKL
jgi:hypothetical protein